MQVPNVLEIVQNYNELPSGPQILKVVLNSNALPSIRINDIVGILAWREADTLDDIKKIYRQTEINETKERKTINGKKERIEKRLNESKK